MEKVLKVGLAGYGLSGEVFHAPFLMRDPRFDMALVLERHASRSAERYPSVQVVRRYEDLLESDVDLIVLGVPNDLHLPMAEAAMGAGKAVVVEKPLAATAAEGQYLFDVAAQTGRLLAVYQNRRWDGGFRTARALVEQGVLGRVVEWETRYDRFRPVPRQGVWREAGVPGVGAIYDLGSHLIDQAVALFGAPEAVWADLAARRAGSAIDDDFLIHLFYPGMRATLRGAQLAAEPGVHITVRGDGGCFVKDALDVQEEALKAGTVPGGPGWGRDDPADWGRLTRPGPDGALHTERVESVPGDYGLFYDAVYRSLVGGEAFPVRAEEAVTVLKIIEAAQESARTGARVPLR